MPEPVLVGETGPVPGPVPVAESVLVVELDWPGPREDWLLPGDPEDEEPGLIGVDDDKVPPLVVDLDPVPVPVSVPVSVPGLEDGTTFDTVTKSIRCETVRGIVVSEHVS